MNTTESCINCQTNQGGPEWFSVNVGPGDFVEFTLVTDTQVYEVISKTAKTLILRSTDDGEVIKSDGNAFPVVFTTVKSWDGDQTETVRLRKDGTYRMWGSNPLRFATRIDGKPVRRTDYSQ